MVLYRPVGLRELEPLTVELGQHSAAAFGTQVQGQNVEFVLGHCSLLRLDQK